MKIHISGKTTDTGNLPATRETPSGTIRLTLYDMILASRTETGSSLKLHSPCGGHLKCKKCTVCAVITEDAFPDFSTGDYTIFHRSLSREEQNTFYDAMHVPAELRSRTVVCLACGMFAFPAITDVYLPDPEEIRGASSENVILPGASFHPVVLSKEITLTKPTVENPIDIRSNLFSAIFSGEHGVSPSDFGYSDTEYTVFRSISDELIEFTAEYLAADDCPHSMNVAVTCSPGRSPKSLCLNAAVVLSIPPCSAPSPSIIPLGLAVDLGTTTIALSLWNLESDQQISAKVFTNPQRSFGADVISRMSYASEHGHEKLQAVVHEAIRDAVLEMISVLSDAVPPSHLLNNILYVSVAGNSVMEHLFCGKPTDSISKAPFYMADSFGYTIPANRLLKSIFCHPSAPVYLAPLAASYIGGDITIGLAYLLNARPECRRGSSIFLDLGTNGEICVISDSSSSCNSNKAKFLLAATAAGPALEGAHIKMGMSAISGAISRVGLPDSEDGEFAVSTISDVPAVGICGSGLIDAIARCLDTGLITEYGRICDDGEPEDEAYEDIYQIYESRISETDDQKLQIALTDTVFLHESDIRQVQTAKAAIAAGSATLLSAAGIDTDSLDAVYLAGSFGGGIDPKTSARIGLLPNVPVEKVVSLGNTSAKGAAGFLLHSEIRNALNDIILNSRYIELSGSPEFTESYVDNMIFGTLD